MAKDVRYGQVVRLDRGFPLVALDDACAEGKPASPQAAQAVRCRHATSLVKGERLRATIGDLVEVDVPDGNDVGLIVRILPRRTALVRKDPAERSSAQVLAANFDRVIVAQPVAGFQPRRLERELVLAHETGALVSVVLTKADLACEGEEVAAAVQAVRDLAGPGVDVLAVGAASGAEATAASGSGSGVEAVRALVPEGTVAILLGKSGVGKSSLVNMLVGSHHQETAPTRAFDGKGRHTTVSREMVPIPRGGFVVDMPGVRGLGLWDAEEGLVTAFEDVQALAAACRFRDCRHEGEPGCAVLAAVADGRLSESRLASFKELRAEQEAQEARREEARRRRRDGRRR